MSTRAYIRAWVSVRVCCLCECVSTCSSSSMGMCAQVGPDLWGLCTLSPGSSAGIYQGTDSWGQEWPFVFPAGSTRGPIFPVPPLPQGVGLALGHLLACLESRPHQSLTPRAPAACPLPTSLPCSSLLISAPLAIQLLWKTYRL